MSAPVDLPDVNVWLALSHPDHVHHPAAKDYWNFAKSARIAFTRATMFGLLRMLTNPKVMGSRLASPAKAWSVCQGYLSMPDVTLLSESPGVEAILGSWTREPFFTGKLWTDAWIAALALENNCRVVSFDADFGKFPGLKLLHLKP